MSIAVFSHPDCLRHDTGEGHPERTARLSSVLKALRSCSFADKLEFLEAEPASREQLLLAHTAGYLESVECSIPMGAALASLDADTVISRDSLKAALRAAGAACQAVDGVMSGHFSSAFCATRPPGHHALPDRAMGFCIFNNIAIAARHAMRAHAVERVAIVDFDVHHGNGTQDIFEHDAAVLYVSTHQSPHWPGTGHASERGAGNIVNIPLPSGTDGMEYRDRFSALALPPLRVHKPQLLLVSAGFDAHRDDPLAGILLNEEDYQWIGEQLVRVAAQCCDGKVVSILEGGYDLQALADSTVSYLSAFL